MCLATLVASAQWKVDSVGSSEPNTKLLQILETEQSTLIYATLVGDFKESHIFNLNRNMYASANGMKYKLVNSVNLPIGDEADMRYVYMNEANNELNFVLEFEKFPVEDGFDIIESTSSEGDFAFNFRDVKVSAIDQDKMLDTGRFLDSASPIIFGKYSEDGRNYSYYIRDGVCVTFNAQFSPGEFLGTHFITYVQIVNNSDHGVKFDLDKVSLVASKKKASGKVDTFNWSIFRPDEYDEFLKSREYEEAKEKTSNIVDLLGDQIDRSKYRTNYGSWERLGLEALGALTRQSVENRVGEYMKSHPTTRPMALRTQGIKAGESVHGYIAAKYKKADTVTITIPMDGFDFFLLYNL